MGVDSYIQFISVLIIFIGVLAATLYVTKWIANYQKGTASGKNIEIIDTCKIATNKYIQIVRIGERYVSIAVSGDRVINLGDVSLDELVLDADTPSENLNFKDILDKIKGEKKE